MSGYGNSFKLIRPKERPQGNVDTELRGPLVVTTLHRAQRNMVVERNGWFSRDGGRPHRHDCYTSVDLRLVSNQSGLKSLPRPIHHTASGTRPHGSCGSKGWWLLVASRTGLITQGTRRSTHVVARMFP